MFVVELGNVNVGAKTSEALIRGLLFRDFRVRDILKAPIPIDDQDRMQDEALMLLTKGTRDADETLRLEFITAKTSGESIGSFAERIRQF